MIVNEIVHIYATAYLKYKRKRNMHSIRDRLFETRQKWNHAPIKNLLCKICKKMKMCSYTRPILWNSIENENEANPYPNPHPKPNLYEIYWKVHLYATANLKIKRKWKSASIDENAYLKLDGKWKSASIRDRLSKIRKKMKKCI